MGFSDDFNRSDRPIHGDPIPGTDLIWRDLLQADGCAWDSNGEIESNALTCRSGYDHTSQSIAYAPTGTLFSDLQYTFRFTASTSAAQCLRVGAFMNFVHDAVCSTGSGLYLFALPGALGFPATWYGNLIAPTAFVGPLSLGTLDIGVDYELRFSLDDTWHLFAQIAGTTIYDDSLAGYANHIALLPPNIAVWQYAYPGTVGTPVASRHRIDDLTVDFYDPVPEFDGDTSPGAFTPRSKRSWQERVPTAYYNPDTDAAYPTDGPYKPGRVT